MRTREKQNDRWLALGISPRLCSGQAGRSSKAAQARQRGVALLLAIFALLLLSAVGLAMLFSSDTETSISVNYRDKQAAIYGALAGLQEARDRIQPVTGDLGSGLSGGLGIVPTALPATGAPNVLYIINPAPGETVAPWLPTISGQPNPYFDDELCHETYFVNHLGVTAGTPGSPCSPTATQPVPAGNAWYVYYDNSQKKYFTGGTSGTGSANAALLETAYQLTSNSTQVPLTYKWVRVTVKSDDMTPVSVTGGTSGSSTQLCWNQNAFRELPLPGNYNPDCTPIVGAITNIPVAANGAGYTSAPNVTISGGTGLGATAVATIGQLPAGITSVTLTNAGAGYTSVPNVTVGGSGTGAIVNATLNPTDPVISVTPTGSTWSSPIPACYPIGSVPTLSFDGPGASATVTMTGPSCIYSFAVGGQCKDSSASTVTAASGGFSGTVSWSGSGSGWKTPTAPTVSNPGTTSTPGSLTINCSNPKTTDPPKVTSTVAGIQVNTVTVTAGGLYQAGHPPNVTFGGATAPVGGSPSAKANLLATGAVGALTGLIIPVGGNGSGYTVNPVPLTIDPPCNPYPACGGVQAQGSASITPDFGVLSIVVTNGGSGYTSTNPPTVTIAPPCTPYPACGGSGAIPGTANIGSAAHESYMGRVYLLTAMAVTPSLSRAMAQMEVGVSTVQYNFGLGGALTLIGPSPGYGTPHSMPFQIIGTDCPTCAPAPTGCPNPTTPNTATDAIGVYDPTNAVSPSAVQTVINSLAKPQNYIGVNSAPDVHNANLGDPTAAQLDTVVDTVAGMATPSNTYPHCVVADIRSNPPAPGCTPVNNPTLNNMGTAANPAFNVVYGNYTMGPTTGYGILVVTGTLTFSGNYSWNGLILVIGAGASIMNGGGNGQITGAVYVANTSTGSLGSPNVNWSGGGGNGIQYDHCWADYMESLIPPSRPSLDPGALKVISTRTEVY